MNRSFFIAHKIIARTNYIKYINDDNQITGCQLNHEHFISLKVVVLERDENVDFYDINDNYKYYSIVNPDSLKSYSYSLDCQSCHLKEFNNIDCSDILESNVLDIDIGIIDIQPIYYFTNTDDLDLSFYLVKKYNDSVNNEFVLINTDNYVDVITNMYHNIRNVKKRIFN